MTDPETTRRQIQRQILVTLGFLNLALAFSFALPAAGMINHLLPFGEPLFGRGLLIWVLLTLICLGFSMLGIPWLRRRFTARMVRQPPLEPESKSQN